MTAVSTGCQCRPILVFSNIANIKILPILAIWLKICIVQYWQNLNIGNIGKNPTLTYIGKQWPICPSHPVLVLNRTNICAAWQILPQDDRSF